MLREFSPKLSLFYCYAHRDTPFLVELDNHLSMLKQLGWIQTWSDRDIGAGRDQQEAMNYYVNMADVLLMLISSDFINSDYYTIAMQQAWRRHRAGEAVVIPILLRPVEWEKTLPGTLQALPRDGQFVTNWGERADDVFKQIASEIRTVVEALRRRVIVISLPQQQMLAERLMNFLILHNIPAWQAEYAVDQAILKEAIRNSAAVVLIASPETSFAPALKVAEKLARMYQRPVFTICKQGTTHLEEQPNKEWHEDILIGSEVEHEESAFQEMLLRLNVQRHFAASPTSFSLEREKTAPLDPRNPYKGLRAFTADDTLDFFGRRAFIEKLASSIESMLGQEKRAGQSARLLAVVGASGAGKSSVVMAGLLPCLRAGGVFDSDEWIYFDPIVPGEHPLEALALTLTTHFPDKGRKVLLEDLQDDSGRGLHFYVSALARQQRGGDTKVVLVVDQFEELFTLTTSEEERQRFIDLLVTACTQRGGSLIVILTLRADFYDRPMQYPPFYALIQEHQVGVLPMTLDDLHEVITRPATLPDVQIEFEEGLVGDLLFDVQGQIGALPLLQFTLDQLFQARNGRLLTVQAYREMRGVKGALSQRAEQTYQDLPTEEHRASVRALFLRLIDPGVTEQDTTRRRANLSEFNLADSTQELRMQETLEAFVKARLLTTNQGGGRTTVEVSHEAVIREWKRLADWLREARDDISLQQKISSDVMEWEEHKQPRDRLYRGVQLKEAQIWAGRNIPSRREGAFLHASVAYQRNKFILLIAVALMLLSLVGTAGWLAFTRPADPTLVTTLKDDGTSGSLRYCIERAPSGSTIRFAPNVQGTIKLTDGLTLESGKYLTIIGPGKDKLTVAGGGGVLAQVGVHISRKASLDLSNLSFRKSARNGVGLLVNEGTLSIKKSEVSDNVTLSEYSSYGGSIYNTGKLTVVDSTFSNNKSGYASFDKQAATSPNGYGGAIYNDQEGNVTITNSIFSGNEAVGSEFSQGGGIYNAGRLTVRDSTFLNNRSLHVNDTNTLDSRLSKDMAPDMSEGGGIFNGGTGVATVTKSIFSGNQVYNDKFSKGGGIANEGTLNSVGNKFSNNESDGYNNTTGFGGGIYNAGAITVTGDSFLGNFASGSEVSAGGGIYNSPINVSDGKTTINYPGQLNVTDSIFSKNRAGSPGTKISGGGGILNYGTTTVTKGNFSGNLVDGSEGSNGGGIENLAIDSKHPGQLSVMDSAFIDNKAGDLDSKASSGGGIFNQGTAKVTRNSFSSNSANGIEKSLGGGIVNLGKLTITISTLINNSTQSSSHNDGGGGIVSLASKEGSSAIVRFCTIYGNSSDDGGGILVQNGTSLEMSGTILAGNSAQTDSDLAGILTSDGYNLVQNFTAANGANSTDKSVGQVSDLKISPTLGSNGGQTQTLALLPGSPAIDAVPIAACDLNELPTDQRGVKRPQGAACDIGAYEYNG